MYHDYVKTNYDEKNKICYLDTDSLFAFIKKDDNLKTLQKMSGTKSRKNNETDMDSLKKDDKEFILNKKLKTQKRFQNEKNDAFTEEIKKVALRLNDDNRKQLIDSIETYAYETSKYIVSEQKCLTLMMLQNKT